MLRPLTTLARRLRSRAPGARGHLTYRMLHVLVVEPEPRAVRVTVAEPEGARRVERPRYTS